jgi:hypothetical protein
LARLTKRDAETMMDAVDHDLITVLTRMLGKVLDKPEAEWETLVVSAEFPAERAARLLARDRIALYELATELNELRSLEHRPR